MYVMNMFKILTVNSAICSVEHFGALCIKLFKVQLCNLLKRSIINLLFIYITLLGHCKY